MNVNTETSDKWEKNDEFLYFTNAIFTKALPSNMKTRKSTETDENKHILMGLLSFKPF